MLCRCEEAEGELLALVSHEDAPPEACLAALKAALAAEAAGRQGVALARCVWGRAELSVRGDVVMASELHVAGEAAVEASKLDSDAAGLLWRWRWSAGGCPKTPGWWCSWWRQPCCSISCASSSGSLRGSAPRGALATGWRQGAGL